MAKKKDIGKYFEDKTKEHFDALAATDNLFYQRWYDTHAAGNFLPAVPADFLIGYRGRAYLFECKASVKHTSLRECLTSAVSDGQIASHSLWHAAVLPSLFAFYSDLTGLVELWDGCCVVNRYRSGHRMAEPPLAQFPLERMDLSLAEALQRHFS